MSLILEAALLFLGASTLASADQSPDETATEKVIREGIMEMITGLQDEDEKTRKKALSKVLPDRKFIEYLVGDDTELVWPLLEKTFARVSANTDKIKSELEGKGPLKEVELLNGRKPKTFKRFESLIKHVDKDLPIYNAIYRREKGSSGSGTYTVYKGKFYWFRGMESLFKLVDSARKKAGK